MTKSLREKIEKIIKEAVLNSEDSSLHFYTKDILNLLLETMPEWMPEDVPWASYKSAISQTEKNFRKFLGASHGCDPRYCEACKRGDCKYCYK